MGNNCANPNFGQKAADRFNDCAKNLGISNMKREEGNDNCFVEAV